MRKIDTIKQLNDLITETYMHAVIAAVLILILAYLIANVIKYGGGKNSTDHIKRRVWYIVIGVIAPIAFFLYNAFYVSTFITKAPLKSEFASANVFATLVLLGIYLALGLLTMLVLRRSKWGSILGKSSK